MSRQGQPLYRYRKEDEALRVVLAIASNSSADELGLLYFHDHPTSWIASKTPAIGYVLLS